MSASTAIRDVTATLKGLLIDQQQLSEGERFEVSLFSPADPRHDEPSSLTVNLFLFRVAENPNQKNQQWLPEGESGLHYPPLSLNLFYVVTPFAQDPESEHLILGEAMRIFYDNSIIAFEDLKDGLENSQEELKIDLCQFDLEEQTRIWNALNKPYRLSACYEVRIVSIDSTIRRPSRRVTEKRIAARLP